MTSGRTGMSGKLKTEQQTSQYERLINQIGSLLALGRTMAAREVNTILVHTYWEIGKYIVEF
jgi:hypothetical protein